MTPKEIMNLMSSIQWYRTKHLITITLKLKNMGIAYVNWHNFSMCCHYKIYHNLKSHA